MVAFKIVRLVDDPTTNIDALQEAIMADQSLAARVLKMANSAYYGLRRNIDTISEAIIMMGFVAIKNLALAVSTKDVYKKFGLLEQKLWEHSIGVSVASGIIAREIRFLQSEETSVAGLLHDIGKAVMNNNQPEKFAMLTETVYNERTTFAEKEKEIFGFGHAEVGGIFAMKWGFPENLCDAIRRHHFSSYDDLMDLGPDKRTLCCIITLADALCIRLGVGYRGPMADLPLMEGECRKILGISDERYYDLIETFKTAYMQEKASYEF
jgi:putative nucleotidyltransferase with HDIG domain